MKKRKNWSLLLAVLIVMSTISPSFGVTLDRPATLSSETTYSEPNEIVRIIVEMEAVPVLDKAIREGVTYSELDASDVASASADLVSAQNEVKNQISDFSETAAFRHSYVRSYNGFSMDVQYRDIAKIKELDNVKSVHIANKYSLPEPQMFTSNDMINTQSMWTLGYEGVGMLVAVIDTGIDFEHPDFAVTDATTVKLELADVEALVAGNTIAAETFAAGSETPFVLTANDLYKSAKVPFAFDYADIDTNAKPDTSLPQASVHGVHVSGTVAANGVIKGVAPEAQIAALKVFSDTDIYAYEDDIVAAIDDAVLIGADVINMSLGATAGFTSDTDPEQVAIENAKNAGLIVAVSAGNSGRFGGSYWDKTLTINPDTGLLGSPSAGQGTFSVASMENTNAMLPYALGTTSATKMQYAAAGNLDPTVVFTAPVPYVYCGLGGPTDFVDIDLTGKIALIMRGSYNFTDKIINAEANGAIGVIVYNTVAGGSELINMMYPETGTIPAIFVGNAHGAELNTAVVKTIAFDPTNLASFPNLGAGTMSSFSSWGTTPSLEFKPEITAPGGDIYSTVNDGKYESMSGTSMSAPHIAGASAIMLEYVNTKFTSLTPFEKGVIAKALMMGTAVPKNHPAGVEYSPRLQGAGLLNLEAAVNTEVYPHTNDANKVAKIALGEVDPVFSFDIAVENFGTTNHEFAISVNAITDGMTSNFINAGIPVDLTGAVVSVAGTNVQTATITSPGVYAITPAVEEATINVFNAKDMMTTATTPIVVLPIVAGTTEVVTVTVDLSGVVDADGIYKYFFNGFFAEGFVQFLNISETDSNPDLSIPFMGFVGDWSIAPIFEYDIYGDFGLAYLSDNEGVPFQSMATISYDAVSLEYNASFLGQNPVDGVAAYENIAFSPNADGISDNASVFMSLLRNATNVNVSIEDADGNFMDYISLNEVINLRKSFSSSSGFRAYEFPTFDNEYASLIWDGKINGAIVADGQYHYVVEAVVDGIDTNGNSTQMYDYPVYVDTQAPQFLSYKKVENDIVVSAKDNHKVMLFELLDADENVLVTSNTDTLDVTGLGLIGTKVAITDYAGNTTIQDLLITDGLTPGEPPVVVTPPVVTPPVVTPPVVTPPVVTPPVTPGTPVSGEVDPAKIVVVEKTTGATVSVPTTEITKAMDSAKDNSVVITLPSTIATDKPIEIKVPEAAMKALETDKKALVIKGNGISFTLEPGFTEFTTGADIVVKITKSAVSNYGVKSEFKPLDLVYDLDILINNVKVSDFNSKPEISITLPAGTANSEKVGAYVQNADGTWTYVMSFYNEETNSISFKAPHFSVYALMSFSKSFSDIKGHWAQANIEEMTSKHVASGMSDTIFAPQKTINRAEFVSMIIRAMGETNNGNGTFSDVTSSDWYAGYLAKAKDLGLIEADAQGNFRPLENITRQDIATITAKAHAIINNIDLEDHSPSVTFTDAGQITTTNAKYVGYVQELGIIVGYNNAFRPLSEATRAEAISIILQMLNK